MSFEESSIERCPHDKEHPFLMVSRELIRDESISPECRWLIIYLLSNTEKWKIKAQQVINHCKPFMGRDKVYALFNEAIDAGYLERIEISESGLKRCRYRISETRKSLKNNPRPENPDAENPDPENQDAKERASLKKEQNKDREKEKERKERESPQQAAVATENPPERDLYGKFVKLSKKEFENLCNFCGGRNPLEDIIAEINDYLAAHGKKPYKDFAAAIRNWYRKNQEKKQWKKPAFQSKSSDYKPTSSANDMPAPILVPLSSIMNTECALTRGSKQEKASCS